MIRGILTLLFWTIAVPITALLTFPWAMMSGDVRPLYRAGMWIAKMGVRMAGIRVHVTGLEKVDCSRPYIFMSNHASNLDPPILLPVVPRRTSVLVKQELFRIPILGHAMRMSSLVPVDRSSRERAIESLREAVDVLHDGISMTIFVEGTRSTDGRLLPFKKGPFHLAMETGVPVVPVTIEGTHDLLPKGKLLNRTGIVRVIFHEPIDPTVVGDRECLMAAVRNSISRALPA